MQFGRGDRLSVETRRAGHDSTRRKMLQGLGAVMACGPLSSLASASSAPAGIHFGVQLNAFPIDPHRFETFLDALAQVRQIGYQGFESSFRNVSGEFGAPEAARRSIEQTGLTFFGIHLFFPNEGYDAETRIAAPSVYQPVARGGAALGARHMILSGAPAATQEELRRKIDGLNAAGRFAAGAGIAAAYHNHWWEFESKIGEIDALYTETDPALVHFVLDAGHAYHGGADVPAFLRRHAQRIVGIHLRDYRNGRLATLGSGTFPLAQVAATIEQIGWRGWVENEEEREDLSKNGAAVVGPAYQAMRKAFAL